MAAGPRAAAPALRPPWLPPPPLLLPLLLVLALAMAAGASNPCSARLEACAKAFREGEARLGADSCDSLLLYSECVRLNGRICRGDLFYHSTTTILRGKIAAKNCSGPGAQAGGPRAPTPPPPPPPAPTPRAADCQFKGLQEFRHCLLFGDPHLKTFHSEFQTCRVRGAWPLIDNPYLGVQVTNEQVRPNSPATATTKVTIVIRGRSHPCAQEKTYQATSDSAALPTTFIDGTQRSAAPDEAVTLRVLSPEHVEIHVRYLDAVLVVRQSGRWLAFSARLPVELLVGQGQSDLQLCVRGCPADEQLAAGARGSALSHAAAWARCREAGAARNDSFALSDDYLDWCIFDVMTTGDEEADFFTAAAYHAQEDVLRLDPASLRNRTTARDLPARAAPAPSAAAAPPTAPGALAAAAAAFLAAALLLAAAAPPRA